MWMLPNAKVLKMQIKEKCYRPHTYQMYLSLFNIIEMAGGQMVKRSVLGVCSDRNSLVVLGLITRDHKSLIPELRV